MDKKKSSMQKGLLTFVLCFSVFGVVISQQQTDTLTIFFDINNSTVDENKTKQLDKLIGNPNIVSINIHGYADFLGSVAYNQQLSEKRSANVRNYLIEKGVDKNIIFSIGKGVHPNSIENNRQDLSDKGIPFHRIVHVIYATELTNLSEENLVAGNIITLNNILFEGGTIRIFTESYPVLDELYEVMQKFNTLKIEIHGHICCSPEDYDNLSIRRALAVRGYLIRKGIDDTRITCKGFGSTRRRYPNERNEYEMQMNRRVEILILEK